MVMAILPFSQASYQPMNRLAPATVEQGVTVAEGEDTLWFKDKVEGLYATDKQMRALKDEGIDGPDDLRGVDEDFIDDLSRGLSQRSYDADGKILASTKLSARTVSRLKGMVKVVIYLSHVRRDITWEAVKWTNVSNFLEEYKILISKADGSPGDVPKYKNSGVVKHIYCLMDYLRLVQGQQGCSFLYLITPDSESDETDALGAAHVACITSHCCGNER
jgi:hypothetical protein